MSTSTKNIADLIHDKSISVVSDMNSSYLNDKEEFFFASEFIFYLFSLLAFNCMKEKLRSKEFIMNIEKEIISTHKKTAKQKNLKVNKEIIRNRFSAYRFIEANNEEMKGLKSEDMFLYLVKKNKKKNDFFLIENFNSLSFTDLRPRDYFKVVLFNKCRASLSLVVEDILGDLEGS